MDLLTNLSILIPNHNEEKIEEVKFWCKYFFPSAEIIIENDKNGEGKGCTLRKALSKSTKDKILFLDGDLDIFPLKIYKLIPHLETHDIVIGTKQWTKTKFPRNIISFLSRNLIKVMFCLPVSDTQTGLKLFKRETLQEWKTNGYIFDIEILAKAHKQGYKIKEVPIMNVQTTKHKSIKILGKELWSALNLWFRLSFPLSGMTNTSKNV